MFWVDEITEEIMKAYPADKELIVRDEKTPSGRVHVGSLMGVAIHGVIAQALAEKGRKVKYYYELNDADPMDGLPVYLDEAKFKEHMGKPLKDVPAPGGGQILDPASASQNRSRMTGETVPAPERGESVPGTEAAPAGRQIPDPVSPTDVEEPVENDKLAKNYAEFFGREFVEVINGLGFYPEIIWASELYKEGRYNEWIEKILQHPAEIRALYKEISGSEKPADWFPLQVVCEKCGKVGTTKVTGIEGKDVTYECLPNLVEWAEGCGHKGKVSPYDGRGKLPWKVEWAVKWAGLPVDIEGSGKDHNAAGGSHEISAAICEKILGRPVPFNIPYEFFLIGGAKMSSSKGMGASAKEIAAMMPSEILRFLLLRSRPNQPIEFNPEGETIPRLFDKYDAAADEYYKEEKEFPDLGRVFYFSQMKTEEEAGAGTVIKPVDHFRPRLSRVAFMLQIPHLDLEAEAAKLKAADLASADLIELKTREEFARMWLDKYALPMHKFEIQMETPKVELTTEQKKFLEGIADLLEKKEWKGEELHAAIHELRKNSTLEAKEGFQAIYLALLGKDSGPQAGWFLEALEKDFVKGRFREMVAERKDVIPNSIGNLDPRFRPADGAGRDDKDRGDDTLREPQGDSVIDDPKIVIGQIEKIEAHPDADRLKVAQVRVGPDQVNQVVCGDLEIYEGMVAPVSLPGAYVKWHGEKELSKVRKAKLRGVESEGMLCAAEELGLSTEVYIADKIVDLKGMGGKVGEALWTLRGKLEKNV